MRMIKSLLLIFDNCSTDLTILSSVHPALITLYYAEKQRLTLPAPTTTILFSLSPNPIYLIPPTMPNQYPVFINRFNLSIPDPDLPTPRYHTTLFVQTHPNGHGHTHQVTGDITSSVRMRYQTSTSEENPGQSETFHSKEHLDFTDASIYDTGAWEEVLVFRRRLGRRRLMWKG